MLFTEHEGLRTYVDAPWSLVGGIRIEPRTLPWMVSYVVGLPVRPAWPGFLANTAIYGSALWLVWITPRIARRWWRRRHGRCVGCAYDVRGVAQCPECGRAVA